MASVSTIEVPIKVDPKVGVGISTYLGIVGTVLGYGGAIAAAVSDNDAAAVGSGVAGLLSQLATQGGRTAQAVAAIRKVVDAADRAFDAGHDADLEEAGVIL